MRDHEERKVRPGTTAKTPGLTDAERAHPGALEEAAAHAKDQPPKRGPGDAPVGPTDLREKRIREGEWPDKAE